MTMPSPEPTTRGAASRWPFAVAVAGALGAAVGLLFTAVYVVHRQPCPESYVRLIDAGALLALPLGVLLVVEVVVVLVTRTPGSHRIAGAFAVVLAVGVVVLLVAALQLLVPTFGSSPVDTGCWTF